MICFSFWETSKSAARCRELTYTPNLKIRRKAPSRQDKTLLLHQSLKMVGDLNHGDKDNASTFGKGYFIISRSMMESDVWCNKPPEYVKVWLYLISKASHALHR